MRKINKNTEQAEPLKARRVFDGSNGGQTRSFCCALAKTGQLGKIAAELFRIQKASARAKVYSGGIKGKYGKVSYRNLAYERKGGCISALCNLLKADDCGLTWGWGYDGKQQLAKCVLYLDLPLGQVSFHSTDRFATDLNPHEFAHDAQEIWNYLDDAVLVGYDIKTLALPLLIKELERCGKDFSLLTRFIIDVKQICREKEPLSLSDAFSFFCGRELEKTGLPDQDLDAIAWVLDAQLQRYPDLPRTITELYDEFATPDLVGVLAKPVYFRTKGPIRS